ncbi:MAG: 16S rRNA (cytosine(1402)-N(4))-methyltransferase RsmH [bacterium]
MQRVHTPVMVAEVLECLEPASGKVYLDGTLGTGGHAGAILERSAPAGRVIGFDADPESLEIARKRLAPYGSRIFFVHARYEQASQILAELGVPRVQGALLDLGFSRVQLEAPGRGFSFEAEGPLDMRMDRTTGRTAAQVLESLSEAEMARLFKELGEERWSRRIARGIERRRRKDGSPQTTRELVQVILRSLPGRGRPARIHPATRVFQALRITVNRELEALKKFLDDLPELLPGGGRFCVISFHSLEDRLVKERFQRWEQGCRCSAAPGLCACPREPLFRRMHRKVVRPRPQEVAANPQSRSARLRAVERL